jgi:alkanesulfonate monooxygenase SsuD/methylene tetrahydromethanopterin reductase-like flavin-dependent oxidoreductase (luciferase family)
LLPAVRKGVAKTGRSLDRFEVCIKPLVATGPDRAAVERAVRDVRARVAFYASTPAYVAAFEAHGLGDLARELTAYSRAQRWDEMPAFISDEILHTYATVGTYDEIANKLHARYGRIVTHAEFSIPVGGVADKARLITMVERLQASQ